MSVVVDCAVVHSWLLKPFIFAVFGKKSKHVTVWSSFLWLTSIFCPFSWPKALVFEAGARDLVVQQGNEKSGARQRVLLQAIMVKVCCLYATCSETASGHRDHTAKIIGASFYNCSHSHRRFKVWKISGLVKIYRLPKDKANSGQFSRWVGVGQKIHWKHMK